MAKLSIPAGKAPCRHCGGRAAAAPVQRMAQTRAFEPDAGEEAEAGAAPGPGLGHDFARVAVSRPGADEDDG